jgi:hypothetical protein
MKYKKLKTAMKNILVKNLIPPHLKSPDSGILSTASLHVTMVANAVSDAAPCARPVLRCFHQALGGGFGRLYSRDLDIIRGG